MFWEIQNLVDEFNASHKRNFLPGSKMVVDESMFYWRGKDQRHGKEGCPHVTKIIRKPKGVGMEVKNLACCDSTIMYAIEVVAAKEEMAQREFTAEHGAGTSLLLRLCKNLRGSGRLIVADSAFASVKSAVQLKKKLAKERIF